MVAQFGRDTVAAYMRHVQDNAEESVRRVITALHDGRFELSLDNGQSWSPASSAASAWLLDNTAVTSAADPAPPEAMTGTLTARTTSPVSSRS